METKSKTETLNEVHYIECHRDAHDPNNVTCFVDHRVVNVDGKKEGRRVSFEGPIDVTVHNPVSAFFNTKNSRGVSYHYNASDGKCLVIYRKDDPSKVNELFCSRDKKE